MLKRLIQWAVDRWLTKHYGERCETRAIGCPNCDVWHARDILYDCEFSDWTMNVDMCQYCDPTCGAKSVWCPVCDKDVDPRAH